MGCLEQWRGDLIMTVGTQAAMAIRAARNRRVWGRWATARLYQLAVALEGGA